MFTKLWVIINCYSQYFKWVIFPYYISTNFGLYLLKFETWHKQMTLNRVHFHVIVLEPIYSDIGISFQLLNFPFKTKSKFLLQMKGVLSSAKLQTLQSRKKISNLIKCWRLMDQELTLVAHLELAPFKN